MRISNIILLPMQTVFIIIQGLPLLQLPSMSGALVTAAIPMIGIRGISMLTQAPTLFA
jgi:hypothetical protein